MLNIFFASKRTHRSAVPSSLFNADHRGGSPYIVRLIRANIGHRILTPLCIFFSGFRLSNYRFPVKIEESFSWILLERVYLLPDSGMTHGEK
jgi:hypothetical protein